MTRLAMRAGLAAGLLLTLTSTSGCGWFGGSAATNKSVSVFDVRTGQCFTSPGQVKAELGNLNEVSCGTPHLQEAYALISYKAKDGSTPSAYPGDAALKSANAL